MSNYVIVGGSRKNPAIERINNSRRQATAQSQAILAEMKAVAIGTNSSENSVSANTGAPSNGKIANVPDIPLSFNKGRV